MGFLARLTGRAEPRARTEPAQERARVEPVLSPEARSTPYAGGWEALAHMAGHAGSTSSGQAVNARTAENMGTVLACVNAIGSTTGSLPVFVYQRTDAGRVEVTNHPAARLVRQPNEHLTWPDWVEWTLAQALLHGNALSAIEHDGAGRATALRPLPWPSVSPVLLPSGRLAYDVGTGRGPVRRYLEGEVFHLRDRSDDGLIGRSRLSRAPDVLGNGLALQEWSGATWRNGATPRGALSVQGKLSDPAYQRLRQQFDALYSGVANAGKTPIFEEGMKWDALSITPEDAEMLASRRFTVEELCRLYQVPPPIIQSYEYNTFTNSAQASLWFAQLTLTPWARKIEAEFARSLFGASSPYELVIDLSGLMRGDFVARWQAWQIAVSSQILDANEVREAEGYSPRAGTAGTEGA